MSNNLTVALEKRLRYLGVFALLMLIGFQAMAAESAFFCEAIFSGPIIQAAPASSQFKISNFGDLANAMTHGMQLASHQKDIFDAYKNGHFGDPKTPLGGYDFTTVDHLLKQNPDLQK